MDDPACLSINERSSPYGGDSSPQCGVPPRLFWLEVAALWVATSFLLLLQDIIWKTGMMIDCIYHRIDVSARKIKTEVAMYMVSSAHWAGKWYADWWWGKQSRTRMKMPNVENQICQESRSKNIWAKKHTSYVSNSLLPVSSKPNDIST